MLSQNNNKVYIKTKCNSIRDTKMVLQEKLFEEVIELFENSDISRYEPSKELKKYFDSIKDIKDKSEDLEKVRKEILLWNLSTHDSPKTLFSPMFSGKTKNGDDFHYPDISTFDDSYFKHYKERFAKTSNPICKCRYGDILWQVKKEFSIIKDTIRSHRDCANIYFDKEWDNEICDSLLRSLSISVSINDSTSIKETYDFIIEMFKKLLGKNRPRFLIEITKLILTSKDKIENIDYDFLEECVKKSIEIYRAEKPDSFNLQRSFYEIILEIGKAKDDEELVKQSKIDIFNSLIEEAEWKGKNYPNGALIKSSFLESALKYAYDNKDILESEVENLKKKIQKSSTNIPEQTFKKIETKIEIQVDKIEEFVKTFEGKETVAILQAIAFSSGIIPTYESARENAEKQAKEFVLQHIIPVQLYQGDFVIKTISGDKDKLEFSTIRNFMLGYNLGVNVLMPRIINLIREQDSDYLEHIIKFFEDAPLIEKDNLEFIKEGLSYYFKNENLACVHIFTFQVESILRNILKIFSVPTFSFRNGEMKARMLDDILSTLSTINGFDKNFIQFLEIFMIDLRGENLRNNVAHGLCEYKYFDKRICDLLFLILIKIASYHITKIDKDKDK